MHRFIVMRADFILPVLLAVALVAMTIYARTGSTDAAPPDMTPIHCSGDVARAVLPELPEASGLATSQYDPHLVWAHNDSAEPVVYAVSGDGRVQGRVRVAGASVLDWEAVTTAPCGEAMCLYVGDIGDNDRKRPSITVYRVPEPRAGERATAEAVTLEGAYPHGPQDAEAMFVANGQLFVITKGEGAAVRLYRFPDLSSERRQTLELVASLTADVPDRMFRVTDAAVSPDGRWVAVRTNDVVLFYDANALVSGRPGTPYGFDLRALEEPQGEGVAWADGRTLYLAGEGEGAGTFTRISCNLPG